MFLIMEILSIYAKRARKNIGDKVAIRIHADWAGWEGIELFGNIRESRISSKKGVNDLSNPRIDGIVSLLISIDILRNDSYIAYTFNYLT